MIKNNLMKKIEHNISLPLMIISAPDGYGKKTHVSKYLKHHDGINIWIKTKGKNSKSLWETLLKRLFPDDKNIKDKIPETVFDTQKLISHWERKLKKDTIIILQDFCDDKFPEWIDFMCYLGTLSRSSIHFVIINQNMIHSSLAFQGKKFYVLTYEDFKVDALEMTQLFKHKGVSLKRKEVDEILEFTNGWPPAIEIALQAYQSGGNIYNVTNLKDLLHKGNFDIASFEVIEGLMKLSIFDEFSLEQALYISENNEVVKEIVNMEKNHLFVNKKDYQEFMFSTMFKEYLKQSLLTSNIDYYEVYKKAGNWFVSKNQHLKAIKMYLEGNAFLEIIQLIEQNNYSYMDIDAPLMMDVFKRMPFEYKYQFPIIYLSYIRDVVTVIDVYEGAKLLNNFKRDLEEGKYQGDQKKLLGEYYFIHAFLGFNDVSKMMVDFHLAYDAFEGGYSQVAYPLMIATFGSFHMLYLYHHTPGCLKLLVDKIGEEVKYFIHISQGVNSGSDYQTKAEYAFETGDHEKVLQYSEVAFQQATINRQTSIAICSLFLQGRYAIDHDNDSLYDKSIHDLNEIYNRVSLPTLKLELESALSYLYILKGNLNEVYPWVEKGIANLPVILYEAYDISYVVILVYLLKTGNYSKILTYCDVLENSYKQKPHVFSMLYLLLGRTIVYYHQEDVKTSFSTLKQLFAIAKKDHIIMIFLEFYQQLYPIIQNYPLEDEFEEKIFHLIMKKKESNKNQNIIDLLTNKEKEVARLFVNNMTSHEVAEKLMISENTVRTHLKNIYVKLNINKKSELLYVIVRNEKKD